uniref:Uncharacterized protein n=1 Tax=Ciona savignyi TaxID=51511 RepID=H2ZJ47_CIOSA
MVTRKFPEVTDNFLAEIEATKKKKPKSKPKGVKEPDKATSKMTDFFKMTKAKEASTKLQPSSEITPENSRKTKSNSETSKNTEINLKPAPIDDMSLLTTAMASFDITSKEKEETGFKCSKSKPGEPFRDITNSDRLGVPDSPTDHSFGLNFSLEGCQTPYKLGSQNDSFDMFCDLMSPSNSPCTQSKHRESSIRPFKHLSTTPIIQPTTDESHQPPNPPSSPVFLTLAERIRLRKASTTVTDN